MAELELDVAHARALAQQLHRHRVAEGVRVDAAIDTRPAGQTLVEARFSKGEDKRPCEMCYAVRAVVTHR